MVNTIRKAILSDASLIASLASKTFFESHGHSAPAHDIESFAANNYSASNFGEELNDERNIFHIIYHDNQPAGYSKIIFNCPHPLLASSAVTKLEKIYLLEEFYDLKLGLELLTFLIGLSKKENQEGIWLNTWIKNERAIRFYEKNGFKVIGNSDFKISETHSNPNYVMYLKYSPYTIGC